MRSVGGGGEWRERFGARGSSLVLNFGVCWFISSWVHVCENSRVRWARASRKFVCVELRNSFSCNNVGAASLFKPTVAEAQHSRGADCLKQLERKSARHGRSLQRRSQNPELRRRAAHHGVARRTGREKGPAGMRRAARRGLAAFAPGKRSERMAPAGVRSYRTRVAELSFFKQS